MSARVLLNDNVNYWVTQCQCEITEHQWNDTDNEKLNYMGKNQSHYHYAHHWPGIKLKPAHKRPENNNNHARDF